jgi:uncharacterized protein (UPF0303 family)
MGFSEDLKILVQQQHELQYATFDEEAGWKLGARLRELAASRKLAVVIDVRRFHQPLFYSALPGTTPDNAEWVRRKSNVVARFHKPSYQIGLELQQKQSTLLERYGLPVADYIAHGGSFPLMVFDAGVIGAITVSGLPQREDHELVIEALCAELGKDYGSLALPASST